MGNETSAASSKGEAEEANAEKLRAIQRMDVSLRRKLRGGVQYNMKVVLKGPRGSGKSTLLKRLQGLPFTTEYSPTPEIQTGTINWSFKGSEDTIKVEVWDVVDKGIKLKPGERPRLPSQDGEDDGEEDAPAGLPFEHHARTMSSSSSSSAFGVLDASMVDVYKQCQSAIFVLKPDTAVALEYLRKEIPQVPTDIPILLLLNFRDAADDESGASAGGLTLTLAELQAFACGQVCEGRRVHCFEASMLNCYGLRTLYSYLGLPFLLMKAETLRRQLLQAQEHVISNEAEVRTMIDTQDYGAYVQTMQSKKGKGGKATSPVVAQGLGMQSPLGAGTAAQSHPYTHVNSMAPAPMPASTLIMQTPAPTPSEPEPGSLSRKGSKGRSGSKDREEKRRHHSPDKKSRAEGEKKDRQRKGSGSGATLLSVAARAVEPAKSQTPNLLDVNDFTLSSSAKELDDFFADSAEEGDETSRQKEEDYNRIASCIRPEARMGQRVDRASRMQAGLFVEEDDDDEDEHVGKAGHVYYGLKPVNLQGSQGKAASPPTQAAALDSLHSGVKAQGSMGMAPMALQKTASDFSAMADMQPSPEEEEEEEDQPTVPMPQPVAAPAEEPVPLKVASYEAPPAPVVAPSSSMVKQTEDDDEDLENFVPSSVVMDFGDDEDDDGPSIHKGSVGGMGGGVLSGISPARLHNQPSRRGGMEEEEEEDDGGMTALEKLGSHSPTGSDVENDGPMTLSASVGRPHVSGRGAQVPSTVASGATGQLSEAARLAIAATIQSLGQEVGSAAKEGEDKEHKGRKHKKEGGKKKDSSKRKDKGSSRKGSKDGEVVGI